MGLASYILAAAVIGLLIGFVALAVGWLRKAVMRNIRSKTVGLLSVYDELLEEKSRELAGMERAAAQAAEESGSTRAPASARSGNEGGAAAPPALAAAERAGAAVYRDSAVSGVYRAIRRDFSFRTEEILPELEASEPPPRGAAGRLLEELEWETVYRLSELEPGDQADILRASLPEDLAGLTDEYISLGKGFDAVGFYDWLRDRDAAEPGGVRLRIPGAKPAGRRGAGVEIIQDDGICEGFQVEEGGVLYDYSIKVRDLS